MWKEALDFDMRVADRATPVKIAGERGFVGVSNVGLDDNWFGNHLSQANLYGFGRLAWNPDLSAQQIADEWTRLTFGNDPKVVQTITDMQLTSWRTYENYTGPLGLQTLTDIVGNHYGVRSKRRSATAGASGIAPTRTGVGMDRTVATGTGYIGQYTPAVARHVRIARDVPRRSAALPASRSVHVQAAFRQDGDPDLYDSHYEGAERSRATCAQWKSLQRPRRRSALSARCSAQLEYQAGQAEVWRDAVTNWFLRASGIPDAKGRVGNYPGRIEAESAELEDYKAIDVTPWEAASGGKAVECASGKCAATFVYSGAPGVFQIRVRYFDQNTGVSNFRALIGNNVIAEWTAADRVPTRKIDSSSSALHVMSGIPLKPGDEIRIEGTPDGGETAALDYIEIR